MKKKGGGGLPDSKTHNETYDLHYRKEENKNDLLPSFQSEQIFLLPPVSLLLHHF